LILGFQIVPNFILRHWISQSFLKLR
jgi:hypothetical protein